MLEPQMRALFRRVRSVEEILGLASCLLAYPSLAQSSSRLMPTPASQALIAGETNTFGRIHVMLPASAGSTLRGASLRLTQRLNALATAPSQLATLEVLVQCACAPGSGLALRGDESSTLTLNSRSATVVAQTEVGVLRAFSTLTQLAQAASSGFTLPSGGIPDRPRYAWRGLMIDVARHFQSIAALKRQIDAMELVKLNVLHLHLSDNEGWRVESHRYPRLHTVASNGEYYTQAQLRDLVAYAAARGVRVVPEIDLPGHSRALATAYPAIASDTLTPRTSVLDPTQEGTYTFLANLLAEVASLFPDPYFHVGADEVSEAQWNRNPAIRRYMEANRLADAHALQAHFTKRLHTIMRRLNKTMIGWDEIVAPGLASDIVVQNWRTSTWTPRATQLGHDVIVSAGLYLDWLTPSATLRAMDPLDMRAFGLRADDRAALRGTRLEAVIPAGFVFDSAARLTASDDAKILGGEAAMWTELVSEEKLDATIWPRTAAVADLLWAPRVSSPAPLDERMDERMAAISATLERIGLQHRTAPLAMRRRLAPDGGEALEVLAQALEPVKYYAHNHKARGQSTPPQQFTALADALPPESATATRFNRLAAEWRPDAQAIGRELRAQLVRWRDQARAIDSLITRSPALADAREASRDLSILSAAALEAMDFIERGTTPSAAWRASLQPVLDRHAAYTFATRNFVASFLDAQPPGDVVLAPLPGLRQLISRATPR